MDRHCLPDRCSIRLRGYDYTQNTAYFVTICVNQWLCMFGDIVDGVMRCSTVGQVVESAWQDLPHHTPGLILDAWVIMPNHLHGIVILPGKLSPESLSKTIPHGPKLGSLGAVLGGFKSAVSRQVSASALSPVRPLWQRNYYERIIRGNRELGATRTYIEMNLARWDDDPDHPRYHPLRP
ncbi:MAG: transposase [Chloroflexi bacterium]|nr:transposase [Chloroflexota bacterium]